MNRRVVAVGAAGTGKTRLACAWASRSSSRGQRVLLTCYNDRPAAGPPRRRRHRAAVHAVGAELNRLIDTEERPSRSIAVLTFSSALRDRLCAAGLGLVRWEDRDSAVGRVTPIIAATARR